VSIRLIAILVQGRIGESDCETLRDGVLAQPVNAISSTAYVIAGLWLVVRALRNRAAEMATQAVFGLTLLSVGVGSVAFHGPQPSGSRLLHDLTIAAVFAVIAARNLGTLRAWSETTALMAFAAITTMVGVVMALSPDAGNAATGVVGAAAVGSEIYLYWSRKRGPVSARSMRWLIAIVGLLVVAGVVNLLGRTDAPLCDPDSLYQGHAAWHALTAVAFGLYGYTAFPSGAQQPTEPSGN
jgi:hypothetical protein